MGYARVSKADGTQTSDLQRDALIAAGVDAARIYEDRASGKREDRPGSRAACAPCGTAARSWSGSSIASGATSPISSRRCGTSWCSAKNCAREPRRRGDLW